MLQGLFFKAHYGSMSNMNQSRQDGAINILLIPLIFITILFIAAAGFGYWAYNKQQHYKNDVNQIVKQHVTAAKKQVKAAKDKEFAQKEKYPFRTYKGPAAYGSIVVKYPKTWSAYVEERSGNTIPVDGYFNPGFVPYTQYGENTFALRLRVIQETYDSVLGNYQGKVRSHRVTVKPYRSPNVPNVIGSYLTGNIQPQKQGEMIIMPFRDKTLELWTESSDFTDDFHNIILKNFDFSP